MLGVTRSQKASAQRHNASQCHRVAALLGPQTVAYASLGWSLLAPVFGGMTLVSGCLGAEKDASENQEAEQTEVRAFLQSCEALLVVVRS